MLRKPWLSFLLPVISAFLLTTIITTAPAPITKDWNGTSEILPVLAPKITIKDSSDTSDTSNVGTTASSSEPNSPPPSNNTVSNQPSAVKPPQPTRSSTTVTASKPVQSTSSQVNDIIAAGKAYIGVPYVYGGTSPSGFDCSGFVQYVFARHGISLPRVSRDQYHMGTSVSSNNLRPGDLVFFSLAKNGVVDHEGIYIGNNQFLNAASSKGVTIYTLGSYWKSVYIGARRVL